MGAERSSELTVNWGALREVAMDSLKSLQSCLDINVGRDGLTSGNICVRYAVCECSPPWSCCASEVVHVVQCEHDMAHDLSESIHADTVHA